MVGLRIAPRYVRVDHVVNLWPENSQEMGLKADPMCVFQTGAVYHDL